MGMELVLKHITAAELARELSRTADPNSGTIRRISAQAIYKWARTGIPADRCAHVEHVLDGAVTRYQMRPDVFGDEPIRADPNRRGEAA